MPVSRYQLPTRRVDFVTGYLLAAVEDQLRIAGSGLNLQSDIGGDGQQAALLQGLEAEPLATGACALVMAFSCGISLSVSAIVRRDGCAKCL